MVYSTTLGVPLHILFDVKTEANSTYAALKSQIQPFIVQYLTHYNSKKNGFPGPLTITISVGHQVVKETVRYMFLSSPLST